jgi:hypothetical protein
VESGHRLVDGTSASDPLRAFLAPQSLFLAPVRILIVAALAQALDLVACFSNA